MVSPSIAAKIQALIGSEKKGAFARRAGISPISLSGYLAGKPPSREALIKIGRAGGVSVDWLLGLTVGDQPESYAKPEDLHSRLERPDQKLLEEIEELLRGADEEVKRHLRDEVKLLKRVSGAKTKRVSGED